MAFYDYSEPIEYVVDRYFKRKQLYSGNSGNGGSGAGVSLSRGEYQDNSLPEIPCTIVRGGDGKAVKFIYGEISLLDEEGSDPVIWQEELVRGADGRVNKIVTTYPSGETVTTELVRTSGSVTEYKYS